MILATHYILPKVYRGLDIVTNKVTPEEQTQVQHHLLDFLDPLSRYSVTDFRNAALPIVERLLCEDKVPVIVGGTNYYIESLLWNVLVDSVPCVMGMDDSKLIYDRDKEIYMNIKRNSVSGGNDQNVQKKSKLSGAVCDSENVEETVNNYFMENAEEKENSKCEKDDQKSDSVKRKTEVKGVEEGVSGNEYASGKPNEYMVWQDTDMTTEELYCRLQEVDPDIAEQYHPNERRKIIRSLQVHEQTGRCHSQILLEQQQQEGGSKLGGSLRFPNTAILWVTCQQDILNQRLDARVDEMIKRGLLQELKDFHSSYNIKRLKDGEPPDYTKGIFQSIGFKEFHEFLILPEEERETEKGKRLYEAGVIAMKLATRQYTRKQIRWIRNRFLRPSGRKVPSVYALDGTDLSKWNENVRDPSQAVVKAMIDGTQPDLEAANIQKDSEKSAFNRNNKSRHECSICNRVVIGEQTWKDHIQGAKHRKMVKRKNFSSKADEVTVCISTVEEKT
ncbi:tRNA dimethylallyltransferase isoform X2 [Panulirus ornatus]|uniref:tRNA dimethylallyltransferase isoform X2 n=1 Tax=Panulirus ornatus TaxID=150431 RepID=UPI003A88A8FD